MPIRYLLAPVIGTGTAGDPYRGDLDGVPIQIGQIETVRYFIVPISPTNGAPRWPWALCEVDAADWTVLSASTKLAVLDEITDATVLTSPQRTRLQAALTKLGVAVTVTNGDTFGGVLDRILVAAGWAWRRR